MTDCFDAMDVDAFGPFPPHKSDLDAWSGLFDAFDPLDASWLNSLGTAPTTVVAPDPVPTFTQAQHAGLIARFDASSSGASVDVSNLQTRSGGGPSAAMTWATPRTALRPAAALLPPLKIAPRADFGVVAVSSPSPRRASAPALAAHVDAKSLVLPSRRRTSRYAGDRWHVAVAEDDVRTQSIVTARPYFHVDAGVRDAALGMLALGKGLAPAA